MQLHVIDPTERPLCVLHELVRSPRQPLRILRQFQLLIHITRPTAKYYYYSPSIW